MSENTTSKAETRYKIGLCRGRLIQKLSLKENNGE